MNFFGLLFIILLSVSLAVAISHVLHIFIVPGTNLFNKYEITKRMSDKEKEGEEYKKLIAEKTSQDKQLSEIHSQQDEYIKRYNSVIPAVVPTETTDSNTKVDIETPEIEKIKNSAKMTKRKTKKSQAQKLLESEHLIRV